MGVTLAGASCTGVLGDGGLLGTDGFETVVVGGRRETVKGEDT